MESVYPGTNLVGFKPLCLSNCDHCNNVCYLYGQQGQGYLALRILSKSRGFSILEEVRKVGQLTYEVYTVLGHQIATSTLPENEPGDSDLTRTRAQHDDSTLFNQMRSKLELLSMEATTQ